MSKDDWLNYKPTIGSSESEQRDEKRKHRPMPPQLADWHQNGQVREHAKSGLSRLDARNGAEPAPAAPTEKEQRVDLLYEWLAPKLSTEERKALDAIYSAVSARAAIIEECAKVCNSYGTNPPGTTYTERLLQCHAATDCADAIRALARTSGREGQGG